MKSRAHFGSLLLRRATSPAAEAVSASTESSSASISASKADFAGSKGEEPEDALYKRGAEVEVEIISFGPLGASVRVNGGEATGLILQDDLAKFRSMRQGVEVERGEVLKGYVMRCRPGRKVDVSLRPVGGKKLNEVAEAILDALEGSPTGEIPVGDKSSPNDIALYFHGLSKREFKSGVGILYKRGLAKPGLFVTQLIEEGDRAAALEAAQSAMNNGMVNSRGLPKKRTDTVRPTAGDLSSATRRRNDAVTMFVGNLPSAATPAMLQQALEKFLGSDRMVDIRLAQDQDGRQRGFGYVEFVSVEQLDDAMPRLKGFKLMGRELRIDYADPARSTKLQQRSSWSKQGTGDYQQYTSGAAAGDDINESVPDIDFSAKKRRQRRDVHRYDIDDSATGGMDLSVEKQQAEHLDELELLMMDDHNSKSKKPQRRDSKNGRNSEAAATLQIGNLAFAVTDEMLQQAVEDFAGKDTVARVKVVRDKETGRSKGYAYVDLFSQEVADRVSSYAHSALCYYISNAKKCCNNMWSSSLTLYCLLYCV